MVFGAYHQPSGFSPDLIPQVTNPPSTATNTIQALDYVTVPQTIKRKVSSTADLFDMTDENGVLLSWFDSTGALHLATPLAVAQGGTGTASLTGHGAVVVNAGGTAQTTVAPGASGNIFVSNGTDWASLTPPLAIGSGGTGATSLAGHGAVVMNSGGTAQAVVAPGANGNGLISNGTDWTSAAISVSAATLLTWTSSANASPTDGQEWYDSTRKNLEFSIGTLGTALEGTFFVQTATKNQNNTASETTLFGTGLGTLTLPANFFVVGRTIRVDLFGFYQSAAGANWTVKVKLGANILATTGSVASTTNAANKVWHLMAQITCYTTGATGNFWCQGVFQPIGSAIQGILTGAFVTVDTTATEVLDCTLQWGTGAVGNTVTTSNAVAEVIA